MAQEQPLFTGYLSRCTALLGQFEIQDFCYKLLLETSTIQISAPGVCTEVSRLYIEALDKGELYDSAADDERLCSLWRWPLNDYTVHASYIVFHWLYTAVYISSHK